MIEQWLRDRDRRRVEARLDAEIEAYYQGLTPLEAEEGRAIAEASARLASELDLDGVGSSVRRGRRRRVRTKP